MYFWYVLIFMRCVCFHWLQRLYTKLSLIFYSQVLRKLRSKIFSIFVQTGCGLNTYVEKKMLIILFQNKTRLFLLFFYVYLVVDLKKLLDSLFINSERNLLISSSIFRISASNLSLMLLNSVSITLKSPSLMGMFLLFASAISILNSFTALHLKLTQNYLRTLL